MRRSLAAACITLLFATIVWAANPSPMNSSPSPTAARPSLQLQSVEPEAATLQVAGPAPMFSYLAGDGRWHRSDELLQGGAVIVVFAPSDEDLVGLQRLAPAFDELGVRPVVVLNLATRGSAAQSRRLGLTASLVSDPMCAIADLYHSIDPATGRNAPSYFVIDSQRTLRAMYFGPLPPAELLVATSARCLGRPLPQSVFTSSDER